MIDQAARIRSLLSEENTSLQDAMEAVHLEDGQVLFQRGEPGDAFYLIESGKVRIFTLDEAGKELTLNTLEAGEAFGELALVDDQPRSASVAAVGSAVLRRLRRDDFLEQVYASPDLSRVVIQLLSQRTRHMTDYIEWLGHWARLVAEGHYNDAMKSIRDSASNASDRALAAVADAVEGMVKAVREREERLRKEVAQLRIEIDHAKRERQVEEITETDYFKTLAQQARRLRKRPDEEPSSGE